MRCPLTVYPLYKISGKHHKKTKRIFLWPYPKTFAVSCWIFFAPTNARCCLIYNKTVPTVFILTGQQCVSVTTASQSPPSVQEALCPWEIPRECSLEGLKFWQSGRYGPICNGLLKRGGTSTAVVVKSLRGTMWIFHEVMWASRSGFGQ